MSVHPSFKYVAAFVFLLIVLATGVSHHYANTSVKPAQPTSATFTPPATGHSTNTFQVTERADGYTYTCTETVSNGQDYINDCNTTEPERKGY